MVPVQAPLYRQYALISDFLDLATLSIQEEAVLATSWIKDRPEWLRLQNLVLATITGQALSSFPRKLTPDVQYAMNNCESLVQGQQLILHGNPSALVGIFLRVRQSFDVFFRRICTCSAVCCFRAPAVAFLTFLQPAVNPLLGCSSGKPVQDQLR